MQLKFKVDALLFKILNIFISHIMFNIMITIVNIIYVMNLNIFMISLIIEKILHISKKINYITHI